MAIGLAGTETHTPVSVTDHSQRGETEDASTFHYLGDTIDTDEFFYQVVAFRRCIEF